jgi:hypothetical protein
MFNNTSQNEGRRNVTSTDKLLPPLLTRFRDIHFKPYTEEEFVEIVVNVLDREEGVDRDIALLIADGVYNTLKSSNVRECIRIARLAKNDFAGRLYYNFSVLICLPQSMEYPDSEATGAAMTPSTFKKCAKEAGFSKVDILSIEHFMWQFYRLTK